MDNELQTIKRVLDHIRRRVGESERNIFGNTLILSEFANNLRSIFTVLISLSLSFLIFHNKPPIGNGETTSLFFNSLLYWGFIYLANIILLSIFIPLIFKISDKVSIPLGTEAVTRFLLIISIILSTLPIPIGLVKVGGMIGLVICLLLNTYFGKWFFFPGDLLEYYQEGASRGQMFIEEFSTAE